MLVPEMADKQITVRFGDGHITTTIPDFFLALPMYNINALFKLLFSHAWDHDSNRETISELHAWLPDFVEDMERDWKQAAADQKRNWKDPRPYTQRSDRWYEIKAGNDALRSKIVSAKWDYERARSVKKSFAQYAARYKYDPEAWYG